MKLSAKTILLFTASFIIVRASAQNDALKKLTDSSIKKTALEKTNASWHLLSLLYQISVDNVTADDKSVNFKSTLYGIHKIFDSTVARSDRYRQLGFQRHFEIDLLSNYQGNFNPANLNLGFNYSFINRNDVTTDQRLNDYHVLSNGIGQLQTQLSEGPETVLTKKLIDSLQKLHPGDDQCVVDEMAKLNPLIVKYVTTGDTSVLSSNPNLKQLMKTIPAIGFRNRQTNLLEAAKEINDAIQATYQHVKRGWNATISPAVIYGFNLGKVQGFEVNLNALKGFKVFSDDAKTSQLVLNAGFVIGDDTIISKSRTDRHVLTDQIGFNQVIFTRSIQADDGTSAAKPVVEASLTGGCNYVFTGLDSAEKHWQPALTAKIGVLIGKESWLTLPFTYNFETHKGFASISVNINLGDPPFK